jgi:long-subunit acyl-CoA synthetase (AMP-forming)
MAELPRSLLEGAFHWERTAPERLWLTQPIGGGAVRELTWQVALDEARRMAAHLRSLALPPHSSIGILTKNCAHFLLADLAIWMAGHVSVALYPTVTASTVTQILTHAEARLLFVGKLDAWPAQAPGVPAGVAQIALPLGPRLRGPSWDELITRTPPLTGEPKRAPDEVATLIYTSGSTGEPKGVMMTFGAMVASCQALQEAVPSNADDRALSHLPLAHGAERFFIECCSLMVGSQVYFAESLDTFVEDLKRARPTVFLTVPRLWQKFQLGVFSKVPAQKLDRLLRIPIVASLVRRKILKELGLDCVRLAATGAAPIPPELLQWYRRLGLELIEGYGMTENFACSHATRPGRVRVGYVGEPYPGVECRISDEGEVQVKSPGMMKGYFKAPELTAEAFTPDGWLRTGDRGQIDELGRLRITGRVKELFKTSKGKYVAPAPIEGKLANHPVIEAACVSGVGRPQPFGLVMLGHEARRQIGGGRAALETALSAHLRAVNAELEPHEALAFVAVVRDEWQIENGFLTPSLKIRRAEIEREYEPHVDSWYADGREVIWQR